MDEKKKTKKKKKAKTEGENLKKLSFEFMFDCVLGKVQKYCDRD